MKKLANKKVAQKIIIAIVIVLSFNFIVPNYSQADFGGMLMGPIIDFVAGIGDVVLSALQYFMYDGDVTLGNTVGGAIGGAFKAFNPFDSFMLTKTGNGEGLVEGLRKYGIYREAEEGEVDFYIDTEDFDKGWVSALTVGLLGDKGYGVPIIKYTPEAIFGNEVPALDVNFIDPTDWSESLTDDAISSDYEESVDTLQGLLDWIQGSGNVNMNVNLRERTSEDRITIYGFLGLLSDAEKEELESILINIQTNQTPAAYDLGYMSLINDIVNKMNSNQTFQTQGELMNEHSIALDLHSTIANWYLSLRNLSIVILLSVLLYIGIRIVISSTASDKAKYKHMLMDWVVALCIVFFLHYLMSFILTITSMITDGINNSTEILVELDDPKGGPFYFVTDLTGLCRIQVQYANLATRLMYLLFYLALVIHTVLFTWTYVKRAITMAFLTLIAPVVAITYPIDKMGDGKAQAFSIWLKEFLFNALLQPFHLIIYTVFLGSASQIIIKNPIFAILFLAFIRPAEKLLRNMFGFEKSSTAGSLGTAASMLGGAALLKGAKGLIGKAGRAGGKGGAGGRNGIRTKNPITSSNRTSLASAFGGAGTGESGVDNERAGRSRELMDSGMSQEDARAQVDRELPTSRDTGTPGSGSTDEKWWTRATNSLNGMNDTRGLSQLARDGARSLGKRAANNEHIKNIRESNRWPIRGVRTIGKGIAAGGRFIGHAGQVAKAAYNSRNPISNTIRGAVGTAKKAAIGTAKFAGKAMVGGAVGLIAGMPGDDLEDVLSGVTMGVGLGVTGLPVLGRAISSGASNVRNTYETEAYGAEEAALRAQDRELMNDNYYREQLDAEYEHIYGEKPTASQSRQFRRAGAQYYREGITDTKEIRKSLNFEKQLREQMERNGVPQDEVEESARKQAIKISQIANENGIMDKLTNEGKRNDLRNRFVRELKAGGMDERAATTNADNIIKLVMKRKGLSPD